MWRIVAARNESPRQGKFIEILGSYYAMSDRIQATKYCILDTDRFKHYIASGAQPTDGVKKLMARAGMLPVHHRTMAAAVLQNEHDQGRPMITKKMVENAVTLGKDVRYWQAKAKEVMLESWDDERRGIVRKLVHRALDTDEKRRRDEHDTLKFIREQYLQKNDWVDHPFWRGDQVERLPRTNLQAQVDKAHDRFLAAKKDGSYDTSEPLWDGSRFIKPSAEEQKEILELVAGGTPKLEELDGLGGEAAGLGALPAGEGESGGDNKVFDELLDDAAAAGMTAVDDVGGTLPEGVDKNSVVGRALAAIRDHDEKEGDESPERKRLLRKLIGGYNEEMAHSMEKDLIKTPEDLLAARKAMEGGDWKKDPFFVKWEEKVRTEGDKGKEIVSMDPYDVTEEEALKWNVYARDHFDEIPQPMQRILVKMLYPGKGPQSMRRPKWMDTEGGAHFFVGYHPEIEQAKSYWVEFGEHPSFSAYGTKLNPSHDALGNAVDIDTGALITNIRSHRNIARPLAQHKEQPLNTRGRYRIYRT